MPVHDLLQYREQVAQQGLVAGGFMVGADGLKVAQRVIQRVVSAALRRLALVGEAVR